MRLRTAAWVALVAAVLGVVTASTPGLAIHGTALATPACPIDGSPGPPVAAAPTDVSALWLCDGGLVVLHPTDSAFMPLLSALAQPSQPLQPGLICLAYADMPIHVVAVTETDNLLVSVPTDACGHYPPSVKAAVTRARGTGGSLTGVVRLYGGPMLADHAMALNGDPAAHWRVEALSDGVVVARTTTDRSGRFAFQLSPGTYTLSCRQGRLTVTGGEVTTAGCRIPVR